jgi:flavin-dependent dehydrogenase
MSIEYDVVIVGAGIPGLYLARELSKMKKRVLVIDKSKEVGGENYSTAGTPIETIKEFSLPSEGIASYINRYTIATSCVSASKSSSENLAVVLDFKKMKILLAKEAKEFGAEIIWDTEFVRENNGLITSKGNFTADFYVDASGSDAVLFNELKVGKDDYPLSEGLEYIVEIESGDEKFSQSYKNAITIIWDTKICPNGYAWVFYFGKNQYKVGVCEFNCGNNSNKILEERLENFYAWLNINHSSKIIEKHGSKKNIRTLPKQVFRNNIIAIGDSICAINPLFGEGIRQGLYSAKFALEAIIKNNSSLYQKNWINYNRFRRKTSELMARKIYSNQSQKFFTEFVKLTDEHFTIEDIHNLAFYYKFEKLLAHPMSCIKMLS